MQEFPSDGPADAWPLACDLDRFDALLFDLDGTLIDTMPLHGKAYADVFAAYGHAFGMADYLAHVGPPARVAVPRFAAAAGMSDITDELVSRLHGEKKARFKEILKTERAPTLPAMGLLARHKGSKPMALVSSGNRDGVEAILRVMGWDDMFDIVITGDDVAHGKPHPEPYLRAAEALGVPAARCIVFEDTQSGIRAALDAGMSVVDVTTPGALHSPDARP